MADQFVWYELMTSDQDAALDFYKKVVGWTASAMEQPDMIYMVLEAGGRGMGGVFQLNEEMYESGARPAWLGYISVADTDAKAEEIAASGGKILMPPGDIPNVGRFAMVADPGGAVFYLLTPRPQDGDGPPPPLEQYAPGGVGWHELYAADGEESAINFYSSRFGWTTASTMDMGEMGTYRIFATGGEDGVGGMMDKPPQMPVGAWLFYFNVDAADAAAERVTANGGQIVMGPMEVPNGMWVLQGTDPQGAHFALVAPHR
jgi:predicted enzyme related to lactoylglutathione lyase